MYGQFKHLPHYRWQAVSNKLLGFNADWSKESISLIAKIDSPESPSESLKALQLIAFKQLAKSAEMQLADYSQIVGFSYEHYANGFRTTYSIVLTELFGQLQWCITCNKLFKLGPYYCTDAHEAIAYCLQTRLANSIMQEVSVPFSINDNASGLCKVFGDKWRLTGDQQNLVYGDWHIARRLVAEANIGNKYYLAYIASMPQAYSIGGCDDADFESAPKLIADNLLKLRKQIDALSAEPIRSLEL